MDAALAGFRASSSLAIAHQVLFSSIAALLGSPGQANYAAANSMLDAIAHHVEQQGGVATSVQWGAWANAGMATQDRSTAMRLQRLGLGLIDVGIGLKALESSLLQHSAPLLVAVPFHWSQFIKSAPKPLAPIFLEFDVLVDQMSTAVSGNGSTIAANTTSTVASTAMVTGTVQDAVSRILGTPVATSQPLMAAGLDSLGAVELRNSLEGAFEMQLPSTLVFDYPTVDAIAGFLAGKMNKGAAGVNTAGVGLASFGGSLATSFMMGQSLTTETTREMHGPALVADTVYRSPKNAFAFAQEVDAVGCVPYQRWDAEHENPLAARFGAYFVDVANFDAGVFGVPDTEAALMDPQQRLVLECVGEAVLRYAPVAVPMAARGVYVGMASSDYGALVHRHADKGAFHATSNALSVACGRVSYTFGMRGPSLSVDTACSASLVATHLAARGLVEGAAVLSYAAGVHVQCTTTSTSYVWAASMLSPAGRCKALDASADGYVRGELCGVVALTSSDVYRENTSSEGQGAGDSLVLAILGSAVNQDGRSSSLTAPSGPAQQEAIHAALRYANIIAGDVSALSMHGTGTALGDPIEVGAAMAVFSDNRSHKGLPLTLEASKAWVGHAEPGAGIAGLLFAQHTALNASALPLVHLRKVNPYVATTLEEHSKAGHMVLLPKQFGLQLSGSPVGVSAFAFQGTNAHAIVRSERFSPSASGLTDANTITEVPSWQRRRHYVLPEANLLLQGVSLASNSQVIFSTDLSAQQLAYLWDHKVLGNCIFPGAGYFEASSRVLGMLLPDTGSTGHTSAVTNAVISAPLRLPMIQSGVKGGVVFQCGVETRSGVLTIRSVTPTSGNSTHVTAIATNVFNESISGKKIDTVAQAASVLLKNTCENLSSNAPVNSPAAAAVGAVQSNTERSGLWMDPAPFDCFLQLGQVFMAGTSKEVYVPAGLGALRCTNGASTFTQCSEAWATALPLLRNGAAVSDFHLSTAGFNPLCSIFELEAKSMGKVSAQQSGAGSTTNAVQAIQPTPCLYETTWSASRIENSHELSYGDNLWKLPRGKFFEPSNAAASAIGAAQRLLASGSDLEGTAVQLQSVGYPGAVRELSGARAIQKDGQAMGSALGGLVRTLNRECPQVAWSLVRVDAQAPNTATLPASRLVRLANASNNDLFGSAGKGGTTFVPALVPSAATEALRAFHLMPMPRGSLTSLVPLPVPLDVALKSDQVLLQVRSVGLNFRDVLNVLGMYPGDPGPPGGDSAGIIVAGYLRHEGKIIAGPGDAAFGLAFGSLGSHVIASAKTLVPMPQGVTFEEASTMPTVFVTTDIALNQLAKVKQGQRVLLHAAAGGVGLAGVQMLRAVGAEPLVTAGGPPKRSLLRLLGASNAASSRDIMFAEELFLASGPADVALNTLTSSGMVGASLAMLAHGGRFIEISKRDIWSSARVAQERPDVHYNLLAVDFMSADALHAALMRVGAGLGSGMLHPLPTAEHSMGTVVSALRQMSQARHVGKVVVAPKAPLRPEACNGRILITGGTGKLKSFTKENE